MKKYKLKLDYTADELRELRRLGITYDDPMAAVYRVVEAQTYNDSFKNLWKKSQMLDIHKKLSFMADINNVVMGTAIFPEKKYVVHDKVTDRYIYFNTLAETFCWSQLQSRMPEIKTKDEWLEINPAYEPRLERVED